jgi:acetylglutamate kinase
MRAATAHEKAATLVEALPWLARFHGRTVVIKYGGHAMSEPALRETFAEDVAFLRYCGIKVVVVHGGGPQINTMLDRLGVAPAFAGGLRVTTDDTLQVVRMVLVGQVNKDVVGLLNGYGPHAVGLSGEDAKLLVAARRPPQEVDGELVDLGHVGDVVAVNPDPVTALLDSRVVPVVASIAVGEDGGVLNVNADTAAAALAGALRAEKLIILTDVEGLYADWPATTELISELTAADLEARLPDLASGMIPKMRACLDAVRGGVAKAHVLDGRVPHALLLEVFTDSGIGTQVVP